MPLSTDPDATLWISLATDRARPEATRPAFRVRFLTVRQRLAMRRLYDEAIAELEADGNPTGGEEAYAKKLIEALGIAVAGWRNIGHPFRESATAPPPFEDVLIFEEMTQLFWLCLGETTAKAHELFRSASASGSAPAKSAATAEAESATLTNSPGRSTSTGFAAGAEEPTNGAKTATAPA